MCCLPKGTSCFENAIRRALPQALKNGIGLARLSFTSLRRQRQRCLPAFLFRHRHTTDVSRRGRTKHGSRTAGQQRILSRNFVEDYEIPLPPLEEQRRIVAEIEGYQKVLDGARQILAGYNPRLEINPEWEMVTLGEVCESQTRGDHMPSAQGTKQFVRRPVSIPPTSNVSECKSKSTYSARKQSDRTCFVGEQTFPSATIILDHGSREHWRYCLVDLDEALLHRTRLVRPFAKTDGEFCRVSGRSPCFRDRQEYLNAQSRSGAEQTSQLEVIARTFEIPLPPLAEQRRIVAELDAEAAQMEAVRALLPRFEAKIQRVLDRVWQTTSGEAALNAAP